MKRIDGIGLVGTSMEGVVVTMGNFDGIHVGHRSILETVVARARILAAESVVYTFEPHPRRVLQPERAPGLLTSLEQKLELFEAIGVDTAIVEPFTLEFSRVSPEAFVRENLHQKLHPVEVYVGYDFHFGKDRSGTMNMLTETGPKLGFSVTIISEVTVGGRDVNSTRIRDLLTTGRTREVSDLLGRPYGVRGTVVDGDRRGRTLGFPTANLAPAEPAQVFPTAGVYSGHVRFLDDGDPPEGTVIGAVANVGTRPTFDDSSVMLIEAHLLDFSGDLYGRSIQFEFDSQLREERKFESVDALQEQIRADVVEGRKRLEAS
ncbi:bifunctional riboflavin kinase/FAD synthetase [Myxococcota bacterium]|nr:bifunctional riboflavin kinase/FAD synthetase [Myxococcota bacterium]